MSSDKVIEIYADTKGHAPCNGKTCRDRLLWAEVVKSGARMCFTATHGDPVPRYSRQEIDTMRLIEALPFDENHWASCPDRRKFSAGRRGGQGAKA